MLGTDVLTDESTIEGELKELKVISGDVVEKTLKARKLNVLHTVLEDNIASSIRRGHPQAQPSSVKKEVVCLVGGGPSLTDTEDELRQLIFEGALVVTVNGSYNWCIERNIRPSAQVIIDARSFNTRFLEPEVPNCRYYIGSQAHPDVWDAVEGREFACIFHSVGPPDEEGENTLRKILDTYYMENWVGTGGGTTVTSRALGLMRMLGYIRFHLFGVDCCWLEGQHHAYDQPENHDSFALAKTHPDDRPDLAREFRVAHWHLKQFEDFLKFIAVQGDKFLLNVHGDGLLAHALKTNSEVVIEELENGSTSLVGLRDGKAEDREQHD